jgi:hypothetical protein
MLPTEEKISDMKDSFHEELESALDTFPKYHTKILLREFNAKVGRDDVFKQRTGNKSLHEIITDNVVRAGNLVTHNNLTVTSTMFSYRNIPNLNGYYLMERLKVKLTIF